MPQIKNTKPRYHTWGMAFVVVVFSLAFVAASQAPITGLATIYDAAGDYAGLFYRPSVTRAQLPPEPACSSSDKCGTPCWYGGTDLASAQGKLGSLTCTNICVSISEYIEQGLCCRHSDCPEGAPVCGDDGRCVGATVSPGSTAGRVVVLQKKSLSVSASRVSSSGTKNYAIILPPSYDSDPSRSYPVFYLLHGLFGSEDSWERDGSIVIHVNSLLAQGKIGEFIIVMPDGDNSAWANGCSGAVIFSCGDYEDYMINDIVPHIDRTYRTIPDAKHRAVGGLSIGAKGSARLTLKHPGIFSTFVGFSGSYEGIIGDMSDAEWQRAKDTGVYAHISHSINDPTPFFNERDSEQMDRELASRGIPRSLRLVDFPAAASHDWAFWQKEIEPALEAVSRRFFR